MNILTSTAVKGRSDNLGVQFFRYAIVGGAAFVIDFCCLCVLTEALGLYYLYSAALAFFAGLTTNYLLSVVWVFRERKVDNKILEYVVFGVLGLLGLLLNQILMYSLTDGIGIHYMLAKAVATGCVFIWNFVSRKVLLFSSRRRPLKAVTALCSDKIDCEAEPCAVSND